MGTVLALIAQYHFAGLKEFADHFQDELIQDLRDRVVMTLDPEVDQAYPQRWIGKVKVHLQDGRCLEARVDEPKGDPGNTLSRDEITEKAQRLAAYSGGASPTEMASAIDRLFKIRSAKQLTSILESK
jgi:2-methylcitrate dehydratase PrpD